VPHAADISNELAKSEVYLEPTLERRLSTAILTRVDTDASNDVQVRRR